MTTTHETTSSPSAFSLMETIADATLQFVTEAELQAEIKRCLDGVGVESTREVRLSDGRSRIDVLIGRIGIEIKIKGSRGDVLRQLQRYAHCDEIDELILVTTRYTHSDIPATLAGIPVSSLYLRGSFL